MTNTAVTEAPAVVIYSEHYARRRWVHEAEGVTGWRAWTVDGNEVTAAGNLGWYLVHAMVAMARAMGTCPDHSSFSWGVV